MKPHHHQINYAIFATLCWPLTPTLAAPTGLEIAQRVDTANSGWKDEEVNATMTLIAADGRSVTRELRTKNLEIAGDGDRSLVIFDKPRDVRGTVFLTHAHKRGNDDQWLFLPALKRTKRIASSNRSGAFMGSEFSYEDIAAEAIERYTYHYLRTEACAEWQCLLYERYPVDKRSGYSKQIVYADQKHYRVVKIEFFDRKGSHQKTMVRENYLLVDKFWRASRWHLVNHLNKRQTRVDWANWTFNAGLKKRDFEKTALKTAR